MKSMNKYLLAICFMLFSFPLSALGYNVNFEFDAGFSECLLSQQIQESRNFWQDFGHFGDYINAGGVISADIVISQNLSFELGIQFKNTQLNYSVKDGNLIANGNVKINYPVIQLPLMVKYSFILKKTTSVISRFCLAALVGGHVCNIFFENFCCRGGVEIFAGEEGFHHALVLAQAGEDTQFYL